MSATTALNSKLRHIPARPGVYLMKGARGEILYVGKAKSLRARVRSYFSSAPGESLKTRELVRRVEDVETIVVGSEAEALILENNLIKEHQPRFNINLRDDKTYPYVKVTVQEPFPRVLVTRRLQKDGARYFGPFTDVRRMRHALSAIKRLYTVRSCHYRLPAESPARPCLDFHIGRCRAPCVALQSAAEYREMIDEMLDVLSGQTARAARRLRSEMAAAAAELRFEHAAELRDALEQLARLEARQKVYEVGGTDRDVVGIARDGNEACGVVLRIRDGKLLAREAVFVSNLDGETQEAVLAAVATRFYAPDASLDGSVPREILFPTEFGDRPILERLLSGKADRAVRTHVPQRGDKARLIELAEQNARHLLEERRAAADAPASRVADALYELQDLLELEVPPRRLVCFDVSHTQGTETVAAAVVFENGRPLKAAYRRFRIKGEWGNDDFRSLEEAVRRYFRRQLEEGRPLPDLTVIDGGKGQLGIALRVLEELDCAHLAVASLAKRDETIYVAGRSDGLRLSRKSPALQLLQRARDEAHRFAVSYNRLLRARRTVRSELSAIPGIGAKRQQRLLERFGSLRAIGSASVAEIAELPGFNAALALRTFEHARRTLQHGAGNGLDGASQSDDAGGTAPPEAVS